jgi:hypothetical protein
LLPATNQQHILLRQIELDAMRRHDLYHHRRADDHNDDHDGRANNHLRPVHQRLSPPMYVWRRSYLVLGRHAFERAGWNF